MPDSYSPTYVEAAWYAWWEKEVRLTEIESMFSISLEKENNLLTLIIKM